MRHRRNPLLVACLVAVVALFVGPTVRAADYPESTDGFKMLNEDLLAAVKAGEKDKADAIIKGLILPNHEAWFAKTFGDEQGKALDAGYAAELGKFDAQMTRLIETMIKEGRTNVTTYKLTDAADKEATGLQQSALKAMKAAVPLYGVRFAGGGRG